MILRFYDFLNLRIYDFGVRGGNFTHPEQYIYIQVETKYEERLRWVSRCHVLLCASVRGRAPMMFRESRPTDEKTDPRKLERRELFMIYDFMNLRLSISGK